MATEATFTVPADQFPLGTVFQQLPDVMITLERIIPAQDVIVPYFWVRETIADDIEKALNGYQYWCHPEFDSRTLSDLRNSGESAPERNEL